MSIHINGDNVNIDINQNAGAITPEKAEELGIATMSALATLQASVTELISESQRGYSLLGQVVVASAEHLDLSVSTNEIDGETITEGESIFLFDQNDAKENGAYLFTSGGWVRDPRMDETTEIKTGNFVVIDKGTYQNQRIVITSQGTQAGNAHELGTDDIIAEVRDIIKAWVPVRETGVITRDIMNIYFDGSPFDPDQVIIEDGLVTNTITPAPAEDTGFRLTNNYSLIEQVKVNGRSIELGHNLTSGLFFTGDDGVSARQSGSYQTGDKLYASTLPADGTLSAGAKVEVNGFL